MTIIAGILNRGGGGTDDDAIHDNVAGEIVAATEKTELNAGDLFLIEDSTASNAKKKIQLISIETARTVYTGTIADDSVWTFDLGTITAGEDVFAGLLALADSSQTGRGIYAMRATTSSAFLTAISATGYTATTGALTGTTGVDGAVTIATATDGNLYIENRTGSNRSFAVVLFVPRVWS